MEVQRISMKKMQEPALNNLLGFLAEKDQFVFLDTSRPDRENTQSLLFLEPFERLVCRAGDDLENYLINLQQRLNEGFYLAGWIGYEFGATLECGTLANRAEFTSNKSVLADLGVFKKPYRFNHATGENNFPTDKNQLFDSTYSINNLRANMEKGAFIQALHRIREYIAAGDTYQVNYTMKLLFDFAGSVEQLYLLLRRNQSVAYGAFIRNGDETTLSFSPEMFFRKSGDEITVKPMKGTATRGRTSSEDNSNSLALHKDIKNRSENVMIVDLLRNDLARLMHGHGESEVFVESLFDVESYESLLQMTSTIKAKSSAKVMRSLKLTEIFRSLFPCGSITGAPKIRTMQIIDELETDFRGVYTGAIGYFGPDGSAAFNVPIRTVRIKGGKGEMGIGAGITHDSVPEEEWDESLLKGRFLTNSHPEFQLLETLLWQPESGYWLLDEHLDRMSDAASFFKYYYNRSELLSALNAQAAEYGNHCSRVRLTLAKDGRATITWSPCEPPQMTELPGNVEPADGDNLPLVAFSEQPVDTTGPWCFHKTTARHFYDRQYQRALEENLFDYLLCNENEDITEGCITNVVILKDGVFYTSPVSCGLLHGVMRQQLLNGPNRVVEKPLRKSDVIQADAIFLCNSVRGVVRVKLKQ